MRTRSYGVWNIVRNVSPVVAGNMRSLNSGHHFLLCGEDFSHVQTHFLSYVLQSLVGVIPVTCGVLAVSCLSCIEATPSFRWVGHIE
jgi:hypothetical protein